VTGNANWIPCGPNLQKRQKYVHILRGGEADQESLIREGWRILSTDGRVSSLMGVFRPYRN